MEVRCEKPRHNQGETEGHHSTTKSCECDIRSQKLRSTQTERVYAWRPDLTDFPKPPDPKLRSHIYNLHIYIVKLENEYWAGWFQASRPEQNWPINDALNRMFTENEGYIKSNGNILFDVNDPAWPFRIPAVAPSPLEPIVPAGPQQEEDVQEKVFFDADEIAAENESPTIKESIRKIRVRNAKAVKQLKKLYNNLCQISGDKYTFKKADNSYYSEAHHLIPLGEGGSDSVYNIIILSPLIHRMLHYAKVEGLDLKNMKDNKLQIRINGADYAITWHPEHTKIVQEFS